MIENQDTIKRYNQQEYISQMKENFKKYISKLAEAAKKNQVNQLLNYAENYQDGFSPILSLYTNCVITMNEYIGKYDENDKFNNSLEISRACIAKEKNYVNEIKKLQEDDNKSFVISLILAESHVFSAVVYKKKDNYELILVNMGGGYDEGGLNKHHGFEKYKVSEENIENIFNYISKKERPTNEIYKYIREHSIDKSPIRMYDVNARGQRVGNCYYKEIEKSLKYAYATAFDNYEEVLQFNGDNTEIVKIPKWPITTMNFNKELVNNILEYSKDDTKEYIKGVLEIYEKNKNFRRIINEKQDLSKKDKIEIFYEIFGEGKNKDNFVEFIKSCLSKVDEKTLQENVELIIDIMNDAKFDIPKIVYESLNMNMEVDFIDVCEKYLEATHDYIDVEFLKEYFPVVANRIIDSQITSEIDSITKKIDIAFKANDVEYIEELINRGFEITHKENEKARLYYDLGNLREKEGYLKDAKSAYKKAYNKYLGNNLTMKNISGGVYNDIAQKINVIEEELQKNSDLIPKKEKAKKLISIGKVEDGIDIYMDLIKKIDNLVDEKDVEMFIKVGDFLEEIGEEEKAIIIYDKGLELLNKDDYKNKIKILNGKAKLLKNIDELDKELHTRKKILKEVRKYEDILFENVDENKGIIDIIANNEVEIGNIYRELGDEDKTTKYYEVARNTYNNLIEDIENENVKECLESKCEDIDFLEDDADKREMYIYNTERGMELKKEAISQLIDDTNKINSILKENNNLDKSAEYLLKLLAEDGNALEISDFKEVLSNLIILGRVDVGLKMLEKSLEEPYHFLNDVEYLKAKMEKLKFLRYAGEKEKAIKEIDDVLELLKKYGSKEHCINILISKAKMSQELGLKKEALEIYKNIFKTYSEDEELIEVKNNRKIQNDISKLIKDIDVKHEKKELNNKIELLDIRENQTRDKAIMDRKNNINNDKNNDKGVIHDVSF